MKGAELALEIIGALAADYLTAKGLILAGGLSSGGKFLVEQLLRVRAEEARDILIDAMSKGKQTARDVKDNEAAAIILRYMRAAEEGAARLNLKLMAQVIAEQVSEPGFYANDFLLWADVLAGLRREEVLILGVMYRRAVEVGDDPRKRTGEFWVDCKKELKEKHSMNDDTAEAYASSLMRTGLIQLLGGLLDIGQAYRPSPNLAKLGDMVDIETTYMETPYGWS
jgi:hypothetical protein